MKRKILPYLVVGLICSTCIFVGCGDEETTPSSQNEPTEKTDTTKTDTTKTDTTTTDTSEVNISVDSTIYITYKGTSAEVVVNEKLADQITYVTDGANVTITNSNETDEFLFVLSGATTDGSFTYNGSYKSSFLFDGVNITSGSGAAVDIECGKRIKLELAEGKSNSLADFAGGEQKAALYCKGHLEVSGSGSLKITGNCKHALASKEYLQLKKTTGAITITKAASDGIHCGEFFLMSGGSLDLSGIAGDGLQVETDANSEEALNGQFIMNGGSIKLTMTGQDTKGIRLDANEKNTSIVPEMFISDGTITVDLTATANGSKAIASDGNFTIGSSSTSPTININVAGDIFTDPTTEEENRATGLKAEKTLTIAGGNTTVNATGNKSRGVRATKLVATGGTLTVNNTGNKAQGIKLDETFISGQGGTVNGKFKY